MRTPWGPSQQVQHFAEGISFVSTAGHGGFKLDLKRNAKVKLEWKQASFCQQGVDGWYEEDCDACLVILTFPQYFSEENQRQARGTLTAFFPQLVEK